ncbi:ATP-binding cassette domain-containing protein [Lactobacillus sp. W8089]|nr:ATP-binding cassette domain-containing protein [Lactobacillus sp. W8086]MBI0109199.1 ATP-binding cassette domain-containing protein [Lactobacillus sp. W8085]MBI0112416.1 ATP-binding cassette domain-containing protein [Lactobacillus sp. W8088]MBI0116131.1 ATP-binding cassette domain-containing protein [Lactobacillus sp. W8087]MBI0119857.1 ATP-binding cassette domain-containing protein [Lactobacillus sp. W8089]MBI0131822.1 ATP-binding cassette domain-containing protein [Lactobacillus sp. W809
MGIFKKLSWFFKKQKRRYLIGIIFLLLTALTNLIIPRTIGQFADWVNQKQLTQMHVLVALTILLAAGLGQYLFRYGWRNQIWGGAADLEKKLRSQLFWHYLNMDEMFFKRHRIGDLMALSTNDISAVQNVAGVGILTLADSVITGGMTIVAMILFVDWKLTVVAILPLPLLAVMAYFLGKKLHDRFSQSQAAFSQLSNKTQESMTGIKVIKTFGQESEDIADFNRLVDRTISLNRKVNLIDAMFDPLTGFIIGLTFVITILSGSHLVINHVITIGQLISFVGYINALIWPMFAIGRLFNVLERGNASYDRIQNILQEKSLITESKQGLTELNRGELHFKVQSFTYPDGEQPVLKNVHFELTPGKTLGIVGRVGAGKSTIIKLILRRFDDYQGLITLDGHDIHDYSLDTLLSNIGYVPQNSFLFSTSVKNNIRFSDYSSNDTLVRQAAQEGVIDEDIQHLSQGYQTLVGERGISLSGGQKQRVSIARALLSSPKILILDDSTSAVDAKTEVEINQNMQRFSNAQQSRIIITQRLRSVMKADEILVLEAGQVIQRGTHQQLLQTPGWYQQMWQRQQMNY